MSRLHIEGAELAEKLKALLEYPVWLVGFSGGLDSTVLLHACHQFLQTCTLTSKNTYQIPRIEAIHIDHQLSRNHDLWAQHCESVCNQLSIELHKYQVSVDFSASPERAAREARYAAIEKHLSVCSDEAVLLLAHHLDDQAETILMRLFRGAGVRGLAAMENQRALDNTPIERPLLGYDKAAVQEYAERHSLSWIEDESNTDTSFDRNYMRREVLPLVADRWPKAAEAMARFATYAAESDRLNKDLARIDFSHLKCEKENYGECIGLVKLCELPAYRRKNLIRYWLVLHNYLAIDADKLEALDSWLASQPETGHQIFGQFSFRIYRKKLYLVNEGWLALLEGFLVSQVEWESATDEEFSGVGRLSITPGKKGLKPGKYHLGRRVSQQKVAINGMHKSVHKLMQELEIPGWLRDYYPVVYSASDVAAIGRMVADEFREPDGSTISWDFYFPKST